MEENARIHEVNSFANLIVVLGTGLIHYETANLSRATKDLLLDTDPFVNMVLTARKRATNKEAMDEIVVRCIGDPVGQKTFGRFFVYLLIMLERMKLSTPDLGRYLDPTIPRLITRES
jgi:hypothetical protein